MKVDYFNFKLIFFIFILHNLFFFFLQNNWNCFSPDRLKDSLWSEVELEDYACSPTVDASNIVSVTVGSNSSLTCSATGDPLPTIAWMAERKIISNLTDIKESTDKYVVYTSINGFKVESTLQLGIYGDHHPTEYTCRATNPANAVERVIKVVVGTGDTLDVTEKSNLKMYILIGVGALSIVLFTLLIVLLICCWCRRKSSKTSHTKLNGNGNDNGSVMVVAPGSSINPIGKPPRQYEKLPQKDFEMTHIVNTSMESSGGHKSFEELNYPGNNNPTYADPRARLPPLEEEVSGIMGALHPSSPYIMHDMAPSPTLTLQSNITQTTTSHFPDLLDNARIPRTISPTNTSYQSLAYPPLGHDWRFSYAHPNEYGSGSAMGGAADYSRSPVAYSTPQHQRPGYVTLPRRPRAPSWSGMPTPSSHVITNPLLSPSVPPSETVYDTLGPRTTADGTSTTDLTRPGSRAALYEPFPPGGLPLMSQTPISPHGLAAHYNTLAAHKFASPRHMNYQLQSRAGTSQTLPRSTPNLLADNSLSIPQFKASRNTTLEPFYEHSSAVENSEVDPLIEDPSLGIPYDHNNRYNAASTLESSMLFNNGGDYTNSSDAHLTNNNNNNNSKNNYNNAKKSTSHQGKKSSKQRLNDSANRNNLKPSVSPNPSDKFSNRTLNSSVSPSPVPTPTQILYSASPHSDQHTARPSPSSTPNANPIASLNNGYSPNSSNNNNSSSSGNTSPISLMGPPLSPVTPGGSSVLGKKKVPPKPPPKPSSKRLSVASVNSDAGGVVTTSALVRNASVSSYQDDGPDGSEV